MAGQPGRSGGHNRKTATEHRLTGTDRSSRQQAASTPSSASRLDHVRRLYAHHLAHHDRLTARLLEKFESSDTSRLQRAIRQETATLLALGAATARLEREVSNEPEPDDPFTEFFKTAETR